MASRLRVRAPMIRASTLLAIVLAAGPVRADDTVEGGQRRLGLDRELTLSTGGLHWQGFAQLSAGATDRAAEGGVAAGGELRVSTTECDLVRIGGQGRLGTSGGAHASAENWASVCFGLAPMVLEIGHHLEWDVRPALLAPLGLRPGENRRETAEFRWQPLAVPLGLLTTPDERPSWPTGNLVVFEVLARVTALWSAHGDLAVQESADARPFRYVRAHTASWGERRDFSVDVGAGGGEFADSGASIRLWLLHLENLELGPVFVTAGAGLASASAGAFDQVTMQHEIDLTTPRLELGVEAGGRRLHGYVRGAHDAAIVPDGYATIETRVGSGVRLDIARTRLGLDTSAALTELHVPGMTRVKGVTGGGALSLAQGIVPHLDATLQLAIARSFYAPALDPASTEITAPRWGVQAFASLQATLGR